MDKDASVSELVGELDAALGRDEPDLTWWSTQNAMTMCSVVLAFGLVVILVSAWLARTGLDKDTVMRVVVVPMVVMSAVFLIVAGYQDHQIAPAMGLLGTIIGYVLGSKERTSADDRSSTRRDSASSSESESTR